MKTQIVLPDDLARELKEVVPSRKRSHFIALAVQTRLHALKFQRALHEAAGGWTDKNHPDLKTQADVNRYLARFRARLRRHG